MDSPSYHQYQDNCIPQKSHLWNWEQDGRCLCVLSFVLIFHRAVKAGNRVWGKGSRPTGNNRTTSPKKLSFSLQKKKDFWLIISDDSEIVSVFYQAKGKKKILVWQNHIQVVTANLCPSFGLRNSLAAL